jgi:hypothetical protein
VLAEWTDDEAQSTRLHPLAEHYSNSERLTALVQRALRAYRDHDPEAGALLDSAYRLAKEIGNDELVALLAPFLDIDPDTGATRPRENVDRASEMELDIGSVRSVAPEVTPPVAEPPDDTRPHDLPPDDLPPDDLRSDDLLRDDPSSGDPPPGDLPPERPGEPPADEPPADEGGVEH